MFELDLGQETAHPAVQEQYGWVSGQPEPSTLSYDAGTHLVTFQLGGKTLQYSAGNGTLTDVFVRTRAVNVPSDIVVSGLVLDGESVSDVSSATADGVDSLRISGGTLSDGFVLTGVATLTWSGTAPTPSRLAFQIKVGTLDNSVGAEPTAWDRVKGLYRN